MLIGGKLKAGSCGKFLRRNIGGSATGIVACTTGIVAGSIAVFSVVFNLGADSNSFGNSNYRYTIGYSVRCLAR